MRRDIDAPDCHACKARAAARRHVAILTVPVVVLPVFIVWNLVASLRDPFAANGHELLTLIMAVVYVFAWWRLELALQDHRLDLPHLHVYALPNVTRQGHPTSEEFDRAVFIQPIAENGPDVDVRVRRVVRRRRSLATASLLLALAIIVGLFTAAFTSVGGAP